MAFPVLLRSCYIALVLIKFATTGLQLCSSFQLPPLATIHHHTKRGTNESTTTTRRYNFIDDFLEEASLERRTSIGEEPVMFAGEDEVETGTTFDFKRWEMHRSSNRYSRMLIGVLFSSTTRRIAPKTLLFVAFSVVVDFYDFIANPVGEYPSTLSSTDIFSLPQLQLPIIPFELTVCCCVPIQVTFFVPLTILLVDFDDMEEINMCGSHPRSLSSPYYIVFFDMCSNLSTTTTGTSTRPITSIPNRCRLRTIQIRILPHLGYDRLHPQRHASIRLLDRPRHMHRHRTYRRTRFN